MVLVHQLSVYSERFPTYFFGMDLIWNDVILVELASFKGEVHDFYKTSWFVEFEALSQMVKVRGSCDKPFKRYSRLKNLLCERPQGTNS